jgi:hypothetical protein
MQRSDASSKLSQGTWKKITAFVALAKAGFVGTA